jgi:hypothetical protein
MRYHWCSGSSGVGTFLTRLHLATGHEEYGLLAEEAAAAVHRVRWQASPTSCHGLAGNGEFLLDMGKRDDALRLAGCGHAFSVLRDSRMLVPDESGTEVYADYQTGLSGFLGFLLRLRDGGPRLWMLS